MKKLAPVAVIIPTFNRGTRIFTTLEKILECDPIPAEIWVHVDKSDGELEAQLKHRFPAVRVLSSHERLGPGRGRDHCLEQCISPYAASFDDDSYPVDQDFFARIVDLFLTHAEAAVLEARIWQRNESPRIRAACLLVQHSFTGCGHALRVMAYRQTRGYIARVVPYGMEETDLAIQLFAKNWKIYEAGELRVFHDTELAHHQHPEITAGTISNVALFAFLHYPIAFWLWGMLQLANVVWFSIRMHRWRGILRGLVSIPRDCWMQRRHRRPLPPKTVWGFIKLRRKREAVDITALVNV
jgi:glycosyltransferase involved in cell wall biosynthesis